MSWRDWIARRLAPEVFRERERYARLVTALRDVSYACGYEFPSVRLVVDWVMGTALTETPVPVTARQLLSWLEAEATGREDPEIAVRLREALEDEHDGRRRPATP